MDKRCACAGEDNKCWGESNKRFRPNIYYEKDCIAKHYSLMLTSKIWCFYASVPSMICCAYQGKSQVNVFSERLLHGPSKAGKVRRYAQSA